MSQVAVQNRQIGRALPPRPLLHCYTSWIPYMLLLHQSFLVPGCFFNFSQLLRSSSLLFSSGACLFFRKPIRSPGVFPLFAVLHLPKRIFFVPELREVPLAVPLGEPLCAQPLLLPCALYSRFFARKYRNLAQFSTHTRMHLCSRYMH